MKWILKLQLLHQLKPLLLQLFRLLKQLLSPLFQLLKLDLRQNQLVHQSAHGEGKPWLTRLPEMAPWDVPADLLGTTLLTGPKTWPITIIITTITTILPIVYAVMITVNVALNVSIVVVTIAKRDSVNATAITVVNTVGDGWEGPTQPLRPGPHGLLSLSKFQFPR